MTEAEVRAIEQDVKDSWVRQGLLAEVAKLREENDRLRADSEQAHTDSGNNFEDIIRLPEHGAGGVMLARSINTAQHWHRQLASVERGLAKVRGVLAEAQATAERRGRLLEKARKWAAASKASSSLWMAEQIEAELAGQTAKEGKTNDGK